MSLISRIEISNYLTEGLVSGRRVADWNPMLTGITLSMDGGESALVNMTNGGGKTSMVELMLYVLSRDTRLLRRVREKASPKARGYTHARIEFQSRSDDTFREPELLEADPSNLKGERRVIGVVLNDDPNDPPIFYSYGGKLEESPCYRHEGSVIRAVPDAEFVARTRSIAGAYWNRHTNRHEWEDHVGLFLPIEVVRRNVVYQLKGSDDQNASFFNVQPRGGQSYEEGFFRAAIAPDLLTNLLNSWSDENETTIEDTLFNSLTLIVGAEREVVRKQLHLAAREGAIEQLRPIQQSGRGVNKLREERDNVLRSLSTSIALLHRFGSPDSSRVLPGLPRPPSHLVKDAEMDRRVTESIRGMVLTSEHGMVLLSTTLASMAKVSANQLQEMATRNKAMSVPVGSRAIDIADAAPARQSSRSAGRRGFVQSDAISMARVISSASADGGGLVQAIEMAFEIAHAQIDTNPAGHHKRMLVRQLGEKLAEQESVNGQMQAAQAEADALSGQLESRQENQAAWEDFGRIGELLPADLRSAPAEAKRWLDTTFGEHQKTILEREGRRGEMSVAWENYSQVIDAAGFEGMMAVEREHAELRHEQQALRDEATAIERLRPGVRASLNQAEQQKTVAQRKVDATKEKLRAFDQLLPGYERYVQCFGEEHPDDVEPEADLARLRDEIAKQLQSRDGLTGELNELADGHGALLQYATIFGGQDPRHVDPVAEERAAQEGLRRVARQQAVIAAPIKALHDFKALVGNVSVQSWLHDVDAQRAKLSETLVICQTGLKSAERELDAIEQMKVLDDSTYSDAWSELDSLGIAAERLFDVLQDGGLSSQVQRTALSALSGLLNAPVLTSKVDLRIAAERLDAERISVPLVLREALFEAIANGALKTSERDEAGVDLCGFLGGVYSHRVRILAEPEYAKAEQERVTQQIIAFESEMASLEGEVRRLATTTPEYQCATLALRAEKERLAAEFDSLEAERRALEEKLQELAPRVAEQSLKLLFSAREFLERGGVVRLDAVKQDVAAIQEKLNVLESRRSEAEVRASFENVEAVRAARSYVKLGGRTSHQTIRTDYGLASEELDAAECNVESAQHAAEELEERAEALRVRTDAFEAAHSGERLTSLAGALEFAQCSEDVRFMRDFRHDSEALNRRGELLLKAMTVNFERAAAFLALIDHTEQALQEALAEQRRRVDEHERHLRESQWTVNRLQGVEIPTWDTLRRAIHELAWELQDRMLTTQEASAHLVSVEAGQGAAEADPMYAIMNEIQGLLATDGLTSHEGVANRVNEATAALAELDIDSRLQQFRATQSRLENSESEFKNQNRAFCDAVREKIGSRESLFNQLELEQIERATPQRIESLVTLFERLGEVARREREDAQRAQVVAQEANDDTLSQLAGLIRVAQDNLDALEKVMARYPSGRFFVSADIVSAERIAEILDDLKEEVERVARDGQDRQMDATRRRRTQDETRVKQMLRESLIERVFLSPKVSFVNAGIHGGRRQPVMPTLSTGQKIALEFMWIVRQAEYEIERGMRELTARQAARSRARLHRVIFIDGIFSTLSDRFIIREALNGLRGLGGNFQIIGFLHSPTWVNDYSVFPVYHVGKKLSTAAGRGLVTFGEAGRDDGTIGFFSSVTRPNQATESEPIVVKNLGSDAEEKVPEDGAIGKAVESPSDSPNVECESESSRRNSPPDQLIFDGDAL